MLKNSKSSIVNNEKGMAVFEMIPILIVIVLFVNFSLGFFGAIHTGILNSISSRNYAFETFRNRANLTYFKNTSSQSLHYEYSKVGMRLHGSTTEESNNGSKWVATSRTIDFMDFERRAADVVGNDQGTHKKTRDVPEGRNVTVGVNPIWVRTSYGICLTAACGS